MRTNKLLFVFFLFALSFEISAQYVHTAYPTIDKPIRWWYEEQSNTSGYDVGIYDYGYKETTIPGTDYTLYEDFKTGYKFDLSFLPSEASNITATLQAWRSFGSGYSVIVALPDDLNFDDYQDIWEAAQNGNEYFEVDLSSGTDHDVTNAVLQRINQGFINFGLRRSSGWGYGNVNILLTVNYNAPSNITAQNNFIYGTIKVGVDAPAIQRNSPFSFPANVGQTVNLEAQNQSYGDYERVWNNYAPNAQSKWVKNGTEDISGNINYSFQAAQNDDDAIYEAGLRKMCNLTFVNNFAGITIDGITYSSPTSSSVVEQNSITASAQAYTISNVSFNFENWKRSDGTTFPSTFTPTDHGTYTAVYRGKPSNSGEYLQVTSSVGEPITITWTDNPNTNVTLYKIYRKVKHNGVVGPEVLLTTVNRGVQTYTDYEYTKTQGYVDLIWYDVRGYYNSTDPYVIGDYQDPYYIAVYGQMMAKLNQDPLVQEIAGELPTEYSISNYPNPFNPTTTIKYQLPEAGTVTIKVYDILGKEVAELVNETKAAGYYEVNFDASKLTSGVYIYTIRANKYVESKKMVLTK